MEGAQPGDMLAQPLFVPASKRDIDPQMAFIMERVGKGGHAVPGPVHGGHVFGGTAIKFQKAKMGFTAFSLKIFPKNWMVLRFPWLAGCEG